MGWVGNRNAGAELELMRSHRAPEGGTRIVPRGELPKRNARVL